MADPVFGGHGDAQNGNASSYTSASMTPANSNKVMYAFLDRANTTAPTSVVFNTSEALTEVASGTWATTRGWWLYRLIAPSDTAATVVASWAASASGGMCTFWAYDTDQTTPDDGADAAEGSGTAAANTVTSATGALAFCFFRAAGTTTKAPASGETERVDVSTATPGLYELAGEASASFDVTMGTSRSWLMLGMNLNAVAVAGATATIVSSLDEITAALNAYMASSPNIVAAVDEITATLSVNQSQLVTVGSELDEIICSLSVNQSYPVTIVSSLDEISAALQADMYPLVTIEASVDEAAADLSANQSYPFTIVSALDEAEASLNAYMASSPNIVAATDEITADLNVTQSLLTTIVAALDEAEAALNAYMAAGPNIVSSVDEAQAALSVLQSYLLTVVSSLDETDSSLNVYEAAGPNITSAIDEAEASLSVSQYQLVTIEAVLDEITAALNAEVTDAGVVIPPEVSPETRYPESGGVLLIPRRAPELVIITPIHPAPSWAVVFGRLGLSAESPIGGRSLSLTVYSARLREAREIEIRLVPMKSDGSLSGGAPALHVLDPYVERMLRAEIEAEMLAILD